MTGFRKLTLVQAKLCLREPMATLFTLLFGPSKLILLGFISLATAQNSDSAAWATCIGPYRAIWRWSSVSSG